MKSPGLIAVAALLSVCATFAQTWWNQSWHYRLAVEVDPGAQRRINRLVECPIDFAAQFAEAASSGKTLDANSLRVIEVSASGAVLAEQVPCQLDGDTLLWVLSDTTPANTKRFYHVYFDNTDNPKPAPAATPLVRKTDGASADGQQRWQFQTQAGYFVYEERAGAFETVAPSACADNAPGKDWLRDDYSQWNGILNVGDNTTASIFHSNWKEDGEVDDGVWGGCHSSIVRSGPLRYTIVAENRFDNDPAGRSRGNTTYQGRFEIQPFCVKFTMTRANSAGYAVIMEMTPGGDQIDAGDYVMLANGTKVPANQERQGDLSPEWFYAVDADDAAVMYFIHCQDDQVNDAIQWYGGMRALCWGFGRGSAIKTTPHSFLFGFAPKTNHGSMTDLINSQLLPLNVTVSKAQRFGGTRARQPCPPAGAVMPGPGRDREAPAVDMGGRRLTAPLAGRGAAGPASPRLQRR